MTATEPSTLDLALDLAAAGYHLAPVTIRRNPLTGRKMPTYHGKWHDIATTDAEIIRDWYVQHGPDVSFCIDCGKSGIVVIDLDVKPADAIDAVAWWADRDLGLGRMLVETPSGGMHLYFRAPASRVIGNSTGAIAPGVDVRGVGGHVYAPGARVVGDPGGYITRDPVVAPAVLGGVPAEVLDLIPVARGPRAPREQRSGGTRHDRPWIERALLAQLDRVQAHPPVPGTGFRGVLMGAAMMHGRAVAAGMRTRDEAVQALYEAASAVWGTPDTDDDEWIRTGLDDGEADPWTVIEPTNGIPVLPRLTPTTQQDTATEDAGTGEERPERPKRLRLRRASQIEPKVARWLWEPDPGYGRLPIGELAVLAGRGNVGKSPFCLWLAARLTHGELPGAHRGTPADVLIYASEDSIEHTIIPRLIAAGADLDRVHFIEGTETDHDPELPLNWRLDLPLIEDAIRDTGAVMLVIDPLVDVHKAGANTDRSDDVRAGLMPLVGMAHRTRCTIAGIAHFNKRVTTDVASLLSGSHGLRDVARAVIAFVKGPDGEMVLGQEKNNLGRAGDDMPRLTYRMRSVDVEVDGETVSMPAFEITGETDATLSDLLGPPDREQGTTELPDEIRWLLDLLAEAHPAPVLASTLAAAAEARKQNWSTVKKKAGKKLFAQRPDGKGGPWVWALTEAGAEQAAASKSAHGETAMCANCGERPAGPHGGHCQRCFNFRDRYAAPRP